MARPIPISHSPARLTPSPPLHQPTNTLAVTSLPKSFFDPVILNMLRDHFDSFGSINQWVPLPGFGRVIIVFEDEQCAELAKLKSDPIVLQESPDHAEITLRVFRADPNPLVPYGQGDATWIPHGNYLRPPAIEKNFLISPPGSPPVGWEQIVEDPPNSSPLADDLISALRRLQTYDTAAKPNHEQLLDPIETGGVGVYLEDYDAGVRIEVEEEEADWVYGETNPTRDRWRQFATAMPPAPMMRS